MRQAANGNGSNSSWYSDYAGFPDTNYPFFNRGGHYRNDNGTGAGMFWFDSIDGNSVSNRSFRPVLTVL